MSNNNNNNRSFKTSAGGISEAIDDEESARAAAGLPALQQPPPINANDGAVAATAGQKRPSEENPTNLVQHMDENVEMVVRPGLPGAEHEARTPKKSKASSSKSPENADTVRSILLTCKRVGVFNAPPEGKTKNDVTRAAMDIIFGPGGPLEDVNRPRAETSERNFRSKQVQEVKTINLELQLKKQAMPNYIPSPLEETAESILRDIENESKLKENAKLLKSSRAKVMDDLNSKMGLASNTKTGGTDDDTARAMILDPNPSIGTFSPPNAPPVLPGGRPPQDPYQIMNQGMGQINGLASAIFGAIGALQQGPPASFGAGSVNGSIIQSEKLIQEKIATIDKLNDLRKKMKEAGTDTTAIDKAIETKQVELNALLAPKAPMVDLTREEEDAGDGGGKPAAK